MDNQSTTLVTHINKGITNLKKEFTERFVAVEDNLDFESDRIDTNVETIETVRRKSVLNERDIRNQTKKATDEFKAVNDRIARISKDLKASTSRLENQMASAAAGSASHVPVDRSNLPVVLAVTIDGIPEGERDSDGLLERCQKYCFRHMGCSYNSIQVSECFRMGRVSDDSRANNARPRTVYCLFNDICYRETVLRRRFELRGWHIFVKEYHPWEVEQDRIRQYPVVKKARSLPQFRNKVSHVANKIILDGTSYGVEDFHRLPHELDPRYIATETRGEITFFFKCDSPLSNHYPCKVNFLDRDFNCVEQAYFVAKAAACGDIDAGKEIKKAGNPKLQKKLGQAITTCSDWEAGKVSTMSEIVHCKFEQNPELMSFLLETKNTYICEDNHSDSFWGIGMNRNNPNSHKAKDSTGNHMGKILQEIRSKHQAMIH
jgi:hypothetical protein